MNEQGWVSIHRQIQNNFLWEDKPFARGQAWIDLIIMAAYKDGERLYRGNIEQYHAGEVWTSYTSLAERWGWGWKKTKNFINELKKVGMVAVEGRGQGIVITLIKYSDFQIQGRDSGRPQGRPQGIPDGRDEGTRTINSNNFNNVNKGRSRGDTHKSFMQKRKEAWDNLPAEWYEGEEDNEVSLQDDNDGPEDGIYR